MNQCESNVHGHTVGICIVGGGRSLDTLWKIVQAEDDGAVICSYVADDQRQQEGPVAVCEEEKPGKS